MGRANALIIRFIDTPDTLGDFDSRRNAAVVRRQPSETAITAPSHEEARPGSWMCGFGLARAREVLLVAAGRKDLVILLFSPRMRADISAALVDTEEN